MKKLLKKNLSIALLLLLTIGVWGTARAGDKIRIILKQPPPNMLGVKDLWKLDITNTTRENIKIYLTGTASESKKGMIVSGKSKVITVSPGTKSYDYNDFKNGEVNWKDKSMQEVILRTGNVPEGSYTICVTAFYENNDVADQESCIEQTIQLLGSVTLVSPGDGTELEPMQPITFSWTPLVPKPSGTVTYRLKVWQLMQGQNGTQAMRTNQPVVSKDVDNITQIVISNLYTGPCKPPYLCDFIWNVQVLSTGGNNVESEPSGFRVKNDLNTITLISPKDGEEIDPKMEIMFTWTPLPNAKEYTIKVKGAEHQNDWPNKEIFFKQEGITTTSFQYPPTGPKFEAGKNYIWQVTSGDVQSEVINFKITRGYEKITLISPKNGEEIEPITEMKFEWKPLPNPKGPVTYRIKVWQLMEGQNGSQAMRTNPPVVSKDVDNLTQVTISNLYTGPCKPPYLCDFIWNIEALTGNGENNGTSEPSGFKIISKNIEPAGSLIYMSWGGYPQNGCQGFGLCLVTATGKVADNMGAGTLTTVDDKTLEIKINKETGLTPAAYQKYFSTGYFILDEDYTFPKEITGTTNKGDIIVKRGSYKTTEKDGIITMSFPSEKPPLSKMKFYFKIDYGVWRDSSCVSGWGICGITIGFKDDKLIANMGTGSVEGDMMTLEFTDPPRDMGSELVVGKDILVEGYTETSGGQIYIKKGVYKVDVKPGIQQIKIVSFTVKNPK